MVISFIIIIALFLYLRFAVHFRTCRKVSEKYPGEEIKGCPNWTLVDKSKDHCNTETELKENSK